jgi:hypothetical protein
VTFLDKITESVVKTPGERFEFKFSHEQQLPGPGNYEAVALTCIISTPLDYADPHTLTLGSATLAEEGLVDLVYMSFANN